MKRQLLFINGHLNTGGVDYRTNPESQSHLKLTPRIMDEYHNKRWVLDFYQQKPPCMYREPKPNSPKLASSSSISSTMGTFMATILMTVIL